MPILSWLLAQPLEAGTKAPDFTLPDQSGKQVSLKSLRGKHVVLVFYPADETPGCRKQLCEFRDNWSVVIAKGAVVFGVNPGDATSHAGFMERHQLPFSLLVDSGQSVARAYNCGGLFVRRTVYLIGKDGKIKFAQRGSPSPSVVLEAIK